MEVNSLRSWKLKWTLLRLQFLPFYFFTFLPFYLFTLPFPSIHLPSLGEGLWVGIFLPFNLFHMIWNSLVTQETTAIGSDKYVVLDADAAEVLVGLYLVEVQPLGTMAL